MAKYGVLLLVFLQIFLVLGQDTTDTDTETTEGPNSAVTTTPSAVSSSSPSSSTMEPTRATTPSTTMPPINHSTVKPMDEIKNATISPKNGTEVKKNGASSLTAYNRFFIVAIFGLVLCVSAI